MHEIIEALEAKREAARQGGGAKRVAAQAWEELFGAASWLFFMPNIETQKPISYQMTREEKRAAAALPSCSTGIRRCW